MRTHLIAAFALVATGALAEDDVMAGFYGNTAVSTSGMGEAHTHYRADHTFDMVGSMMGMSRGFKGTWALDGKGHLCRTFEGDTPPNLKNPSCVPIQARKPGDSWTVEVNGGTANVSLKPGIQ